MRARTAVTVAGLAVLTVVPDGRSSSAGKPTRAAVVQIEMRNVRLHLDEGIVLHVTSLRGEMLSRTAAPPVFDDQRSYVLKLASGNVSMDMDSLTTLMNRYVFGYPGAPLSDLELSATDDGRLEQKAKLHKGVTVPVTMKASVGTTPEGELKLHVDSMSAMGIPAKGLLGLFGLKVDDLVKLKEGRGVALDDNDIIVSPGGILPPPEIRGTLAQARLDGGRLHQVFARADGKRARRLTRPDPRAPNYIYFGGGVIRFGKLTMTDADLQLIDADPRDPFDFYPAKYNGQLVAGYSKNTPQRGLKTYMPDYDDLQRRAARR